VLDRVGQHAGGRQPAQSGRRQAGIRPDDGRRGRPAEGSPAANVPQQRSGEQGDYNARDPVIQVEREALKLAVQRPALCGPAFDALGPGCFTAPVHAAAFEIVAGCGGTAAAAGGREWAERLRNAAPDDQVRAFITQLAVEPVRAPGADGEPDTRYIEAQFARVEELAVSRDIAKIKSRLQRMNPVTEQAEYNRMFGDLVALEQRRKVLSGPAADALQ
jgi:DNA primase